MRVILVVGAGGCRNNNEKHAHQGDWKRVVLMMQVSARGCWLEVFGVPPQASVTYLPLNHPL